MKYLLYRDHNYKDNLLDNNKINNKFLNKDKIKDKFIDNNNKIKNAPITKVKTHTHTHIYIYKSMLSIMRKRIHLN